MSEPVLQKSTRKTSSKKAMSGILWVILLLFGLIFGLGVFNGYMDAKNGITGNAQPLENGGLHLGSYFWLILASGVALALTSIPLSLVWWRTLDEGQKEAHKWAWIWGGAAGLTLPAPLAVLCNITAAGEFFDPSQSHEQFFFQAYMGIMICGLAGYGAAWVIWWWRHR